MDIRIVVPQIGQSIAEATIVKWFKQPGERIEKGEVLVEIGTDKINTEIPAPESGVVSQLLVEEGRTVPVETEIAILKTETASPQQPEVSAKETTELPPEERDSASIGIGEQSSSRFSPLVRRLAQEHNVDLEKVTGTGRGGRVTKEDVLQHVSRTEARISQPIRAGDQRVPMTRMRRLIAEHMLQSKRTTAELTTVFEVDMSRVVQLREQAKETYEHQHGIRLTFLPFIIAAVTRALQKYPVVNSTIEGDMIVYKTMLNIGVATAVEDGLLVPVIRDAGKMGVLELARALDDLAKRARSKRLTADDLQEGTFTITNPGVFGAILGTPIIHYPQVAILGVGAVEKRPVVLDDAIAIRSMAFFSLTYDHRALDGSTADPFLAHIKRTLEQECPLPLE